MVDKRGDIKIMKQHLLRMTDISVEFPGVKAIEKADITFKSGEIHALVGANGAGKSTLMKVLSGVNTHYKGQVYLDDVPIEIRSPKEAKKLGIEIVYQEVDSALVPYLTVAENIMLNKIANGMDHKAFINWKQINRTAREVLQKLNMDLDVGQIVSGIPLAQKQMVLIARAMVEECKFLMLDEPTAPLSNSETEDLFRIVRELVASRNIGVVFISHRLREIFQICKRVTVMRNGMIVNEFPVTEKLGIHQIVESMLGKKVAEERLRKSMPVKEELLRLDNISNESKSVNMVSLVVGRGEIVGISGLVGAGKTELCKLIFGADRLTSGAIYLNGRKVENKNPTAAVNNGFALIPEERRKEGIEISAPIYDNLSRTNLKRFCNRFHVINFKHEKESANTIIDNLKIKTPGSDQVVGLLSGGNQQKVALGKWFASDSDIYIFDEPTKGVDIGAKQEIYQLILSLTEQGKGVIYATCEFSEILSISDRSYVMYNGTVSKELVTENTNEEELLYYSTGGK